MDRRARYREAGDRDRVAPPRFRPLLGLEIEAHRATPLAPEIVALIVRMAGENPLWSRRRIANELAKLGQDVGKDAVAKYMPRPAGRPPRPPSQTWGTFIRTHAVGTIAIDFFTVPTVTFGVL
jgi:putative transposase